MNPPTSAPGSQRRLAVVISHPTQYYGPWFRQIAAVPDLELRVFYLWDFGVADRIDRQFGRCVRWDTDLLSGYPHEFVPNLSRNPGTHHFRGLHNPTLGASLRAFAPDAILVFGYAYRTHLSLFLRRPAPLIFRGDSHLLGRPRPSWPRRVLLSRLFARCASVTYTGLANRDYFRAFGVPEARLHFAPHCVDAARFARTPLVERDTAALRQRLDLGDRRVVLFAGKFLPAKQPLGLLEAFIALAPRDAALVFAGDGEQRAELEARAAAHPGCIVRFMPFANQSEMPARYALADLFVLPSRGLYETWGLAVNEAMHLGVPCLVSDRVGCQRDLVSDGETGWVFPAAQPGALAATLGRALRELPVDAAGRRQRVIARVSQYTYPQATAGLLRALAAACR